MRSRVAAALIASAAVVLASAAPALADANKSANWSGYAAHRAGVRFDRVKASWIQPSAACVPGNRSYSAFWVGLGGYSRGSAALEQIGTEVDCAASGAIRSTAWYELVPQASRGARLQVRPGDAIDASVTVNGRRVSVALHDATTGRWFRKTLNAAVVDTSSAEWIAEAPSVCIGASSCETLPLANFGNTRFTSAKAETARGHVGSISDRAWGRTKISLRPRGRTLLTAARLESGAAEATPSALGGGGSMFTVRYSQLVSGQAVQAQRGSVRDGRLVHPGLS